MATEMRRSERHKVRFKLVYDDGETFNAGIVRDVSEGGVFLETALPLPVDTQVRLTPLEVEADDLFDVPARVVRIIPHDPASPNPPGMGLEFLEIGDDERERIVKMITELEQKAADFDGEHDPILGVMLPSEVPTPADD